LSRGELGVCLGLQLGVKVAPEPLRLARCIEDDLLLVGSIRDGLRVLGEPHEGLCCTLVVGETGARHLYDPGQIARWSAIGIVGVASLC
jgi:hypothetical protein